MWNKRYLCLFVLFLFGVQAPIMAAESRTPAAVGDAAQAGALTVSVGQYSENIPKSTFEKWVFQKTDLGLSFERKTEFENTSYCPLDKYFCDFALPLKNKDRIILSSKMIVNEKSIKTYLEDLAKKVDSEPANAKFSVSDGKVTTFSQERNGVTLNIDKSLETIASTLKSTNPSKQIALVYDSKKPEISYSQINNLGISSLIGEGVSNFKGSPANRIHNIKVAAEKYDGILIKPGEEFSFVKILGEVDGDHGYLPELVIKNNVTEPEFGGGICQVSTTAFRAAIYSGLKITARKNHAYPVSYYNPQGMDSTVYVPSPDLRFINNTPGYILIQTKIVGTVLTFDFYGTDDGRKTTIDGPKIVERQPDGALKTTFAQHVFNKDGKEFINDVFNSSYNSPYKYPHPGGPVLTAKPSNWSDDEWKNYKSILKDMAKVSAKN